jgi:hypothetical protein
MTYNEKEAYGKGPLGLLRTPFITGSISAFITMKNLAYPILFILTVCKSIIITLWLHHTIRKTNLILSRARKVS